MKCLVVSHNSISETSNNGKTLLAVFKSFKKEELVQIYFNDEEDVVDEFATFYRISDLDVVKGILKPFVQIGSKVKSSEKVIQKVINYKAYKLRNGLKTIRELIWFFSPNVIRSFVGIVKKESPDIVFFLAGDGIFSHRLISRMKSRLKLPLVTYFTDDYFEDTSCRMQICLRKYFVRRVIRRTVRDSQLLYGIGVEMCELYKKRFDRIFYPLMNCVDLRELDCVRSDKQDVMVYIGSLHLGRDTMILRFAELLQYYNKSEVRPINLYIYSQSNTSQRFRDELQQRGVIWGGAINGEQVRNKLQEANYYLHVESDDLKHRKATRYSVSTKIPEYLSSGGLVIAYGPPEVASNRLLHDNGVGCFIDSTVGNVQYEQEMICQILRETDFNAITSDARSFAEANFDVTTVSSKFKSQIKGIIDESR